MIRWVCHMKAASFWCMRLLRCLTADESGRMTMALQKKKNKKRKRFANATTISNLTTMQLSITADDDNMLCYFNENGFLNGFSRRAI